MPGGLFRAADEPLSFARKARLKTCSWNGGGQRRDRIADAMGLSKAAGEPLSFARKARLETCLWNVVARDGIEPPTPAFSGPRSTTELSGLS